MYGRTGTYSLTRREKLKPWLHQRVLKLVLDLLSLVEPIKALSELGEQESSRVLVVDGTVPTKARLHNEGSPAGF